MGFQLGGVSMMKATDESNTDTGSTYDIYPNYGYFLPYHQIPIGDYVSLDNRIN